MAKKLLPVDDLIASDLRDRVSDAGLSYRDLSAATGMSINRIGIILRKEPPPATVGELSALASAVGSTATEIITAAELSLIRKSDLDLVANETINEFPDTAEDADYDQA